MSTLLEIVTRTSPPVPWSEGDNIPWDDPVFSERMLAEHLSQEHDLASRRTALIDSQVTAITALIAPPPARVLDLGCGPGLYLSKLADAGYTGVGIDFSPASIRHARTEATRHGHDLEYRLQDIRTAALGTGFDAVLLLYGQLNVFRRDEARYIIERASAALRPGGVLIVEPQTNLQVEQAGHEARTWSAQASGLFSADPHLLLTESFWDPATRTSTERFFVVDATTGDVSKHALSNEAYTDAELEQLLRDAGFDRVEVRSSLGDGPTVPGLCVVIGVRTV
jgi:2-polyprenyl-3-methyl-5-hydroxy-6-metoxy-1,4-benzoquinol methylase